MYMYSCVVTRPVRVLLGLLVVALSLYTILLWWQWQGQGQGRESDHSEAFKCSSGTYTHPEYLDYDSNGKKNKKNKKTNTAISSELTELVGANTVCTDTDHMEIVPVNMEDNGAIQVGERVYVNANASGKYYLATVVNVYPKGAPDAVKDVATEYTNTVPLPGGAGVRRVIARPQAVYSIRGLLGGASRSDAHAGLGTQRASATNMTGQPVNVATQAVHADADTVDVEFDDADLRRSQEEKAAAHLSIRYRVDTEVVRMPQTANIEACARHCVAMYPDAWGIQTGKCLESTCACACVVPVKDGAGCQSVYTLTGDDEIQTALREKTQTDLHQFDATVVTQLQMLERLQSTCSADATGWKKPPESFPCRDSAAGGGSGSHGGGGSTTTTPPPSPGCCPNRCAKYTGLEKKLCMNHTDLQQFLNNMPITRSVGSGVCAAADASPGAAAGAGASCAKKRTVPCEARTRSQCTAQSSTLSNTQCAWYDALQNNSAQGTGCYDKGRCMFTQGQTDCNAQLGCEWDGQYCIDEAFCPHSCPSLKTAATCTKNTHCKWNGRSEKCSHTSVMDPIDLQHRLDGSSSGSSSSSSNGSSTILTALPTSVLPAMATYLPTLFEDATKSR